LNAVIKSATPEGLNLKGAKRSQTPRIPKEISSEIHTKTLKKNKITVEVKTRKDF